MKFRLHSKIKACDQHGSQLATARSSSAVFFVRLGPFVRLNILDR